MRIWVKGKRIGDAGNLVPHNVNIATAMIGFHQMGAHIELYEKISDIYDWVTKSDIVISYIGEVDQIFAKFNASVDKFNYPTVLLPFLGRKVWEDTINSISSDPSKWGCFVKPEKEKAFTGKIINSLTDLVGCGSSYEDYTVVCSEVIDIKAEWRMFVKYDEILDIRPYGFNRDYNYHYDYKVVKEILEAFKTWEDRPLGCSIDICVTSDNRTLLVEVNDSYALGAYGLDSLHYAKLIAARWSQVLDVPNEFNF